MKNLRAILRRRKALLGLGVIAGLFVLLSIISTSATGQAGRQSTESPEGAPNPGMGSMAFKVIGSVLLVIGVLYAGMYALRTVAGRRGSGGLGSGAISVLHRTHIAPKKAIYVVKVGKKAMVVGVTDSQISHLSDLSEEDLGSLEVPGKAKAKSFKQHFLSLALGAKERT
jgi:flagellar biosynthetic protein FliO